MWSVAREQLSDWCRSHLGSPVGEYLFEHVHLSVAAGVRLADSRQIVVKVRPFAERLHGCFAVQKHLHKRKFPCPEPLIAPTPLSAFTATAERLVPGGALLAARKDAPVLFATALARLVDAAPAVADVPSMAPAPPWIGWDHDATRTWPEPDDLDVDLNTTPGPQWLDETAGRVRARLTATDLPDVVGHGDFESQNTRWIGSRLLVVHDWDSAVSRPEAALAGQASAVFSVTGRPGDTPNLSESAEFLNAYAVARGRPWTSEEHEVAWAAGLWVLLFNAKKETVAVEGGPGYTHLAGEVTERLRLAGA
ncbi:phosphotransferase [Streptomyces rochei]|uniref:phosphotransferase n=1 Tax=Streptomyces rochei TaxID=1928 RepID=UPI0013BBEFB9|nr:phosphotransferase [Streptomyces rochei]